MANRAKTLLLLTLLTGLLLCTSLKGSYTA